jgi:DNA polymerase
MILASDGDEVGRSGAGRSVQRCEGCPYGQAIAVGARGVPQSPIALGGEAPGKREVEVGRPFVGPAGRLLEEVANEVGIRLDEVFIVNAVACLPVPTTPRKSAILACRPRLVAELARAPRSVIVTLGATATRSVLNDFGYRVVAGRGQPRASLWGDVMPTVHPAYVRRRPSSRALLLRDLEWAEQRVQGSHWPGDGP